MPEYLVEISYNSDKILFGNDEVLTKSSNLLPEQLSKEMRKCEISSLLPQIEAFLKLIDENRFEENIHKQFTKGFYSWNGQDLNDIPSSVKYLQASNCGLKSITDLKFLSELEFLDLSENEICNEEEFANLSFWPRIKWLNIKGNPLIFTKKTNFHSAIQNAKFRKEEKEKIDEKELFASSNFGFRGNVSFSDSGLKLYSDWKLKVVILNLKEMRICKISVIDEFLNVKTLILAKNLIKSIFGIEKFTEIEELDVSSNEISSLSISFPKKIRRLHLGKNKISSFGFLGSIETLMMLSLEENLFTTLESFSSLPVLLEIYLASNQIIEQKNLNFLKIFPRLMIIDLWGNPIVNDSNYRIYTLFQLPKLKVLDGIGVDANEVVVAKELFTGRLTEDILHSRLQGKNPLEIKELKLCGCGLKDFEDVFNETIFPFLETLDLSDNEIASLQCFQNLPKLKKLCISKNKIELLAISESSKSNKRELFAFEKLISLDLSLNSIKDISTGGAVLPFLLEVNFSKNELTKIDRLDFFPRCRILDFSKNKIRSVEFGVFTEEMELQSVKFDDNALKTLPFIFRLRFLRTFSAANNRIADLGDIDRFFDLQELREFDLFNNPVNRRPGYRFNLIKRLPLIEQIDQKELSEEEKEQLYMHSMMNQNIQQPNPPSTTNNVTPQTLNQILKGPIKVNALNFDGLPNLRLQNEHFAFNKK